MDSGRDIFSSLQRLRRAAAVVGRKIALMEVCGTHTMSAFRSGLHSLLPVNVKLIAGPGCPVCVTAQGEIDLLIELAGMENITICTYGDMLRVPGGRGTPPEGGTTNLPPKGGATNSLEKARARGADVRVIYSALDAVKLARRMPERQVVLGAVGFETTAPATAACVVTAARWDLRNFSVLASHKRVVPAVMALMGGGMTNDECRMTNQIQMTKGGKVQTAADARDGAWGHAFDVAGGTKGGTGSAVPVEMKVPSHTSKAWHPVRGMTNDECRMTNQGSMFKGGEVQNGGEGVVGGIGVDGFLLPGHVSVVIGVSAYREIVEKFGVPCVVAGFEEGQMAGAMARLVEMIAAGQAELANEYREAVSEDGNARARGLMAEVFESADAAWRGLGMIAGSGLKVRRAYEFFDAIVRFGLEAAEDAEIPGCLCGKVITGAATPHACKLFEKVCTPVNPVGPCMVSSEGTCQAYFKYARLGMGGMTNGQLPMTNQGSKVKGSKGARGTMKHEGVKNTKTHEEISHGWTRMDADNSTRRGGEIEEHEDRSPRRHGDAEKKILGLRVGISAVSNSEILNSEVRGGVNKGGVDARGSGGAMVHGPWARAIPGGASGGGVE